ncbi:MAG TPA: glycosyltransferase family 4 protein [Candidatus Binatia bacterium]|nr:glycosyltransferase family 4 protein [Candidatus Binatia bacterium]
MKIGLVHKRLDLKGGTERDLFQTAEGLRDLGHEIHLFCSEYGVEPPHGVVAHRVPVIRFGRTLRLWSFDRSARAGVRQAGCHCVIGFGRLQRQDILRCGGGTHRGFLHELGQNGGWRRRLWQRASLYHRSLLMIEKRQYDVNGAQTIIAVSEQVKRDIIANYSVPAEKIVVVYNGVDHKRFHPGKRGEVRDQLRGYWKIPFDAPLILFVGSGFRRKGLHHLLSIWKSPRLDRAFLLVVGTDPRMARYRARAESIAPGRIIFAGRQEQIENYYAAADGLALPALQEAFGNVVIEALASGLPVVVSRAAGASEIIRGSLAAGILEEPGEAEILERKLLWLLEKSRDSGCAQEARRIAEEYSWENHFRKLEDCLLKTCRVASAGAH